MLIVSGPHLIDQYQQFMRRYDEAIIFSPYIKLAALETLLDSVGTKRVHTIVTTWKPIDIAVGVSDLSVYPFCSAAGVRLLLNDDIHLKAIVDFTMTTCLVSSSNITGRGLSLGNQYNFELGTIVDRISAVERAYFDRIIGDSIVVTDSIYSEVNKLSQTIPKTIENIPSSFGLDRTQLRQYTTSDLPWFGEPHLLYSVQEGLKELDEEGYRSAMHDLHLFGAAGHHQESDFFRVLRAGFRNHYFIRELLEFCNEGRFFGRVTDWLHQRIQETPTPYRRDIKAYQQRIYRYIELLLPKEFEIVRPNHSELLRKLEDKDGQKSW